MFQFSHIAHSSPAVGMCSLWHRAGADNGTEMRADCVNISRDYVPALALDGNPKGKAPYS